MRSHQVVSALVGFICFLPGPHSGLVAGEKMAPASPCPTPPPRIEALTAERLGTARSCIQRLRQRLEQWGVVTMSAPVVMRVDGQFDFGQDKADFFTPKEYIQYEQGAVIGASAQSSEAGILSQTTAEITPTAKLTSDAAAAAAASPTPTPEPSKLTPAPVNIVTNAFSGDRPAAPGGLFRDSLKDAVKNSGRLSVLQGINDKISERIQTTMANPPYAKFSNHDYGVYFAIVQVSCNPGWRTRVNYAADLSATCEYFNTEKKTFGTSKGGKQPLIFSVLPLIDAQTLELSNSERRVQELAAQVSGAYPNIGLSILGQELLSFVHRSQKDVVTRTPMTVSNSYATGHTFGFRLAPSLTAQRDPASRNSGTANVLQSTSFPVLVTVVVNYNDFPKECFDSVLTRVSCHWIINERPPLPQFYRRLTLPLRRESFDDRQEAAEDLMNARSMVDSLDASSPRDQAHVVAVLRDEVQDLESKIGNQEQIFRIHSSAQEVSVTGVARGQTIPIKGPFSLIVKGANLQGATKVLIGNRATASQPVSNQAGTSLIAEFAEGDFPFAGDVPLAVTTNERGYGQCMVSVSKPGPTPTPKPAPTKEDEMEKQNTIAVSVSRAPNQGGDISIQIDRRNFPGVSDEQLLERLTRVLGDAVRSTTEPSLPAAPAPSPAH